jgi:hypothetical protein
MNGIRYIAAVTVLGLFLVASTKAKEVRFATLPEVVRTTVFHHYNISGPEKVVRVVEQPITIYEITVVTDSGDQVVYVNSEGDIVERPRGVEETEGGSESTEVTVTMDDIDSGGERYEFVQEQGPDAIYIDHQTEKRVVVKGGAGKERGGVRTKEGGQTDVQTKEKNLNEDRNQQNKSEVRTDEKNQQPGTTPQKTDENRTSKQKKGGARTDERDQQPGTTPKGTDESNAEQKDKREQDTREQQRTQPQRTEQSEEQRQKQQRETDRKPGEQQQTQERTKDKGKASPTP